MEEPKVIQGVLLFEQALMHSLLKQEDGHISCHCSEPLPQATTIFTFYLFTRGREASLNYAE